MNGVGMAETGGRSRRFRSKIWFFATFAMLGVLGVVAFVYFTAGVKPPGDELKTDQEPYGWHASKDVGSVFTDGLNIVVVTDRARGPIRVLSARPLMDDGKTVRVVGILARINPDMLPHGFKVGGFQESPGFPPTMADAAGAVPVEGLVVQPPREGEQRWIELQIGYEVVAPGRSARRGVELVYKYEGTRHKMIVPSFLAVCAPATVTCPPEYDS